MNSNPLALITGGSAGIGLEMAKLLAADGYDVMITGVSQRVFDAAASLSQSGATIIPIQADLSAEAGNQSVLDAIAKDGRPVSVAIINAGIATGGVFKDLPLDEHLTLIGLNIISPVRLVYALIPQMIKAGGGKFLFVSSLSATTPTPYEGVYGPSKAFLSSFGNGIREELKEYNIQVTNLHPGATATEFHARAGMGDTRFGDNGWKNDPALVAKQGIDALKRGDANVVGGDEATHQAWELHKTLSEEAKAERHAKQAKPGTAKDWAKS